MSEQLSILPQQDPDELIARAREQYQPVKSYCLFSGGKDSTVLAYRCREHYDELVFIDTGTAVHGVEDFVREVAADLGKPLRVYRAGDAFRELVLHHGGFPGPAGHGRAYTRLKERQIEALVRDAKQGESRLAKVMLLTGKRRAESARRSRTTKGIEAKGGQLYVNPLIDWTANDMYRYRMVRCLPESPVAALLGMSGECGCGAFGDEGEWEMRCSLYPEWGEQMRALECEAEAAGVRWCRWGGKDKDGNVASSVVDVDDDPALCASCVWQQMRLVS